jgi:hypothetical protein
MGAPEKYIDLEHFGVGNKFSDIRRRDKLSNIQNVIGDGVGSVFYTFGVNNSRKIAATFIYSGNTSLVEFYVALVRGNDGCLDLRKHGRRIFAVASDDLSVFIRRLDKNRAEIFREFIADEEIF